MVNENTPGVKVGCRWCGNERGPKLYAQVNASHAAVCNRCGARGPLADTEKAADAAWSNADGVPACRDCNQPMADHINGCPTYPPLGTPGVTCPAAAGMTADAPADIKELLTRFERSAHRAGELWERCQGKGWPDAESEEFTKLRDERLPALRAEITGALGVEGMHRG